MKNENINSNPAPDNNESRTPELDAKELIRKHIEDPNHEITDEDIRNVKLGETNDPPIVGAEAMSRLEDIEEDNDDENEEEDADSDRTATPWDVRND